MGEPGQQRRFAGPGSSGDMNVPDPFRFGQQSRDTGPGDGANTSEVHPVLGNSDLGMASDRTAAADAVASPGRGRLETGIGGRTPASLNPRLKPAGSLPSECPGTRRLRAAESMTGGVGSMSGTVTAAWTLNAGIGSANPRSAAWRRTITDVPGEHATASRRSVMVAKGKPWAITGSGRLGDESANPIAAA